MQQAIQCSSSTVQCSEGLREVPNQGPDLGIGIHKVLHRDSGVFCQANVGHHAKLEGVGRSTDSRGGSEVELWAEPVCAVANAVVVDCVCCQVGEGDVVEQRGGVVVVGVSVVECVDL